MRRCLLDHATWYQNRDFAWLVSPLMAFSMPQGDVVLLASKSFHGRVCLSDDCVCRILHFSCLTGWGTFINVVGCFYCVFTLIHEMTCHAWSEMLNAARFLPCDYSILAHILSRHLVSVRFLLHAPLLFERSDDPRFVSHSHPIIQKGKLSWSRFTFEHWAWSCLKGSWGHRPPPNFMTVNFFCFQNFWELVFLCVTAV